MSRVFSETVLIGRERELAWLAEHSKARSGSAGLFFLARPGAGATAILTQTSDRLFFESGEVMPVHFAFDRRDRNAARTSLRFARGFLTQAVAFGRKDNNLISALPTLEDLERIASPRDSVWLDPLFESFRSFGISGDSYSLSKQCFAFPQRAAVAGKRIVVLLDAVQEASYLVDAEYFIDDIRNQWSGADFRFVLSAHRRFFGTHFSLPRLMLDAPSNGTAAQITERLAAEHRVVINGETRDLIAAQMKGDIRAIDAVIRRAAAESVPLNSFPNVERIYSDEIFAGSVGAYFDGVIAAATPSHEAAQSLIGVLFDSLDGDMLLMPIEKWNRRIGISPDEFNRLLHILNVEELIRVTSNRVEIARENVAFADYIRGRFRLELAGEARALVVSESLAEFTRRAPKIMARKYRNASALDLCALMSNFERRTVPRALLDYAAFKENYKGLPESEVSEKLRSDDDRIDLPSMVFSAPSESFYPNLRDHIDAERSTIGVGFQMGTYDEKDETVWLAAEIESKLEATRDAAEFWCDRLEAAALMCGFPNYRIWLISPDGFTVEALEIISQRNGFGSSRRQAELLAEFLGKSESFGRFTTPSAEAAATLPKTGGEIAAGVTPTENEYEITIPMGEDGELAGAKVIEDIARSHGFKSSVINQIKTAVVEACINAAEHSHSPDKQISLSINVSDDRINVTVTNRGVRLSDQIPPDAAESETRRGWGLKLMQRLMDEVRFEQTDDGTRISMSKLLEPA